MLRVVVGCAIPVLATPISLRIEVSTLGMAALRTVHRSSASGAGHPLLGHRQACAALAGL